MHTFLSTLLQQQQERTTMTSIQWSILSKWTCKRRKDIRHSTRVTTYNRRLLCFLATGSILFLSALLLIIHHSPTPTTQTWLPVQELSQKYRNWTYYVGPFDGFVVPPTAGNFTGQTMVDNSMVYETTREESGKYRMTSDAFNYGGVTIGGNNEETQERQLLCAVWLLSQ